MSPNWTKGLAKVENGRADPWTVYASLNESIADTLFGLDHAGRPVYALPDQQVIAQALHLVGIEGGDESAFCEIVRGTLVLEEEGTSPFTRHVGKSQLHARAPLETPPSLALLVVLSMAADGMHAGDGMAAHNYYGRLMARLRVPEWRQGRVQSSYQAAAEDMWSSLNSWLEAWEGERGVPTSYAVGQRFIGLPMSQALVRQHDRQRLTAMFVAEGLPPGYQMASGDMESVLDVWVSRQPPLYSQAFRLLWGNATARDRIAAVACLELEAWRGEEVTADGSAAPQRQAPVRLMALVRTFPRALELNVTVPAFALEGRISASLLAADGPIALPLVSAGPGTLRLEDTRHLDPASLLTDELSLELPGVSVPLTRLPRRLVPMRFDDLQNCYVEVERVQLGERCILVLAEDLRARVEQVLAVVARPGWIFLDPSAKGVPAGWLVVQGVQVFDRFSGVVHVDLQPLLPRTSATLVLSGGSTLPGRLRKWSSLDPPEIQAVMPGAENLSVRIDRGTRLGEEVMSRDFEASVAVMPLALEGLPDGEYMVTLWVNHEKRPAATSVLRLRSGDTPVRELAGSVSGLVYAPSSGGLWPLSAGEPDGSASVDGARIGVPSRDDVEAASMPAATQRIRTERISSVRPVRIGRSLGERSCMQTGAHRFELPPALPGRPVAGSVEGECTTCGLVKRFPSRPHGARRREVRGGGDPIDLGRLPPVILDDASDQSVAFDSLCHLGRGTISEFTRIAAQVEASALFADVFLRNLELLGHIDVRRDPETMRAVEFELTPPTLACVGGDVWWLVGRAPRSLVAELSTAAYDFGADVSAAQDKGIPKTCIRLDGESLAEVLELAVGSAFADVRLVGDAARDLARSLPAMSDVAAALPRVAVPAFDSLAWWKTGASRWEPSPSIARAGAYRLGGFAPLYAVRSSTDLERGTIAIAGPQLAKHIANLWAGDPLAGYHSASSSVVVPLGCDVPGLYGRALALGSGQLPFEVAGARMLQYRQVTADVAAHIHARLAS